MTDTVTTCTVAIHMAGDIETAKRWLRAECYRCGLCVTIAPETFIYTGGEEEGFVVGLVNYPRFPSTSKALIDRARELANGLILECCQRSALLVTPGVTEWIHVVPPGAPEGMK